MINPQVSHVVIEPATAEDLDELSDLLGELFSEESDFRPNKEKQLRGLRLIFEQPNRGRVFVLRRDHSIVGHDQFALYHQHGGRRLRHFAGRPRHPQSVIAIMVTARNCSNTPSILPARKISCASPC